MSITPKMKKKVILHRGRIEDKDVITMQFNYDKELIQIARALRARWNPQQRVWSLMVKPGIVNQVFQQFHNSAIVDCSQLSRSNYDNHSHYSQNRVKRLTKNVQPRIEKDLDKFRTYMRSRQYSENTVNVYCSMIEMLFSYYPSFSPNQIDRDSIEKFMAKYLLEGGYANSTRRQAIAAFKLFFERIEDRQLDTDDLIHPFKEVRLPIVLSKKEVKSILDNIKNIKHFVLISLIYAHGLRIGEALSLKLSDVDFARDQLIVQKAKGRKWRNIPLSTRSRSYLKKYLSKYRPATFVFEGEKGKAYSRSSAGSILKRAVKAANIEKRVTLHTLRHSYATHLLESGVDIRYIQTLLGHKSPNTTMIYTHVRSQHLDTLVNPFDELG